ncbi:restriction endonuclease subunit S [Wolbachia pipientis]|uniref:Restriction endonuclease subunit S n=1 Tax=Wolbachia pipientis TaxID=955 RepID=A0A1E7QJL6_WOLPI|nr:HU family DNA-binding protein [Wolbachia pipientis]OEY86655.1 restriction endonuclease subunit S [Wolbachia pipientis]
MNKEEFVKHVLEEHASQGIKTTKSELNKMYKVFMQMITKALQKGHIRLHGVGTIYTIVSKEKLCRNPQSGETMTVPPKVRVKFKASQSLLDVLNDVVN